MRSHGAEPTARTRALDGAAGCAGGDRCRSAGARASDHRRRAAAGHRLRHAAGFTGFRVARHRRRTGTLRRPRDGPLRLLAKRPRRPAGQFYRPDRRGRASRSLDRDQGRGYRALEPRQRYASRSTATIRRTLGPSPATPRTPCWSMRAAEFGLECAMRVSTYWTPRRGASNTCATMRTVPRSLSSDRIYSLALDRSGTVWIGTEAGLDRALPNGGFTHFSHVAGDPSTLERQSGFQCARGPRRSALGGNPRWRPHAHGPRWARRARYSVMIRCARRRSAPTMSAPSSRIKPATCGWVRPTAWILLDRSTGQFTHYHHDASDASRCAIRS